MLSIATDYVAGTGDPQKYLRQIAAAGFTHIHWCQEWATEHLYARDEIQRIAAWLKEYGLQVTDLHATNGTNPKDAWWVDDPGSGTYQTGMQLIQNRIEMTAQLGSDMVIVHLPRQQDFTYDEAGFYARLQQTLDTLAPFARHHQVRLAVENLPVPHFFNMVRKLFGLYGADYLGLCYDSGHGQVLDNGLDNLETVKDRLIATHLHDNDGTSDQHKLPFTGTVDWTRLARLLAASSYTKFLNQEVSISNSGITDEAEFLKNAFEAGTRLAQMVDQYRKQ